MVDSISLNTEAVLRDETVELWGESQAREIWEASGEEAKIPLLQRYQNRMLKNGQAALCLSGGGIRSAAFALGVVQALSRKGLLSHFQYLSTVSGGGYLGGFLSRWIAEEREKLLTDTKKKLRIESLTAAQQSAAERPALQRVQHALGGGGATDGVEPAPIRWLRENSNFLTPRIGLASADTWTAIAMSVRNILINWMVFAPALLLAVAFPYLGAALLAASDRWFADFCLIAGGILIALAAWAGARVLPSHVQIRQRWSGGRIFTLIVLPAALGAATLSAGIAPHLWEKFKISAKRPEIGIVNPEWLAFISGDAVTRTLILAFLFIFIPLLLGYVAAWIAAAGQSDESLAHSNRKLFTLNLLVWVVGATLSAAFYVWGVTLALKLDCKTLDPLDPCAWQRDVIATFAVVWGILSQLALSVFFVAFRVVPRGAALSPDLDREWLARVSAEKIRIAFAWTLFAGAALLLPHIVSGVVNYVSADPEAAMERLSGPLKLLTAMMGVITGAIAVFGGKSATTGVKPEPGATRKLFSSDVVVAIATFVFLLILLFVLGRIEFGFAWNITEHLSTNPWSLVVSHLEVMAVIGMILGLTSTLVQVNRFSLNGLYRNRLARAFLGAAREKRGDADPFTGFAPSDNIRLHALKAVNEANGRRVLMPVVNVALNLVGGTRLAWQERKAQAFIFTPIACGSANLGEEDPTTGVFEGRYVRTQIYAGSEPDLGLPGDGVSLATAIAISGAAASPSMGYHSSPTTAFLMTLFNVRLGAWLPNPGVKHLSLDVIKSSGPRNALFPLVSELLGLTDAQGSSVYLSDGGHFENLGLYEMVRRRCRHIIVSDAGCDPGTAFEDLGNAIRKARIDLGVHIEIQTANIVSCGTWDGKSTFFAVGKICYPTVDGAPKAEGDLLYIKPSCVGDIPTDVRAYALKSKNFPHESTGDQWFSESQFESYRSLGEDLVFRLGKGPYADSGLGAFFTDLIRARSGMGDNGEPETTLTEPTPVETQSAENAARPGLPGAKR